MFFVFRFFGFYHRHTVAYYSDCIVYIVSMASQRGQAVYGVWSMAAGVVLYLELFIFSRHRLSIRNSISVETDFVQ